MFNCRQPKRLAQIVPYQNKTKTGKGLVEYLILQKPSSSAILASLLIASFLTATILPWISTVEPTNAKTSKTLHYKESKI